MTSAQPPLPPAHFIDRDLSWLQFNERVLAEAREPSNPVLERAKFLSITASNLDEFFMIRVASLARTASTHQKQNDDAKAGQLQQTANVIFRSVRNFAYKQRHVLRSLLPELEAAGIHLSRTVDVKGPTSEISRALFEKEILPHLQPPEAFGKNDLTLLSNLETAAIFNENLWIRIPKNIPLVLQTMEKNRHHLFFLDDLLTNHLGSFYGLTHQPVLVRLTRDGDVLIDLQEEDPESIPDAVRKRLGSLELGRVVRLQYAGNISAEFLEKNLAALKLQRRQAVPSHGILCLRGLSAAANQLTPQLAPSGKNIDYPPMVSFIPPFFQQPESLFDTLQIRDLVLHHPYDSFDAYVTWIQTACADPAVTAIEQTIYRMDALSRVMEALKSAAGRIKIKVVIELRARFDELNNLQLAEDLRKAGIEVAFGSGKLKLHAKVTLVTRNENGTPRLYTHLSTGNYNAMTARQYTDLAILTANPEIGADARLFFDSIYKGEMPKVFKQFVSAPGQLHRKILSLIESETTAAAEGKPARIIAKVNALVDREIIEALYKASNAGVRVDLIVRGACSLIPGVKNLSHNIRVTSIVDRFLEHSRIYFFENSRVIYLSSADWMPRNFFSRNEIAFPVIDPRIFRYLEQTILPAYLRDNAKAWELNPRGKWKRIKAKENETLMRSQVHFQRLAGTGYEGTSLV